MICVLCLQPKQRSKHRNLFTELDGQKKGYSTEQSMSWIFHLINTYLGSNIYCICTEILSATKLEERNPAWILGYILSRV